MMRLTISKIDNIVSIDDEFYSVDLSSLPNDFHVLQWYDSRGEIEKIEPNPYKIIIIANESIDSIDEYQWVLDAWSVEKQRIKNEQDAFAEAQLAAQQSLTTTVQ